MTEEYKNWYLEALKNYANFTGRARRKEYWYFILINAVITAILTALSPTLSILYGLFAFVPTISVGIRRLHDVNKTGWWYLPSILASFAWEFSKNSDDQLLAIVALVSAAISVYVFFAFLIKEGTSGTNQYGKDPLSIKD